jgi:serine protease Do
MSLAFCAWLVAVAAAPDTPAPAAPPPPMPVPAGWDPARSLAPLVKAVEAAVVTIEVESMSETAQVLEMFGRDPQGMFPHTGEGSGFVISADGLVLTNHHVIAEAARIVLVLSDGTRAPAHVLGSDAAMDVALLQADTTRTFTHVALGDSDDVEVGDWVVAMGNGLGLGTTVTSGIVSGKGRIIGHDLFGKEAFLQTDAAINQRNSGGPLFDLQGRVIGMSTAIIAGANTVGFAIPSNLVSSILDDLRTSGRVARGFLGVQQQTLNEELRRMLGIKAEHGAVVTSVFDDTPASRSGLRRGDVVVAVDAQPVVTDNDLVAKIGNRRPGDRIVLTIERDAKIEELKVTLTDRPGGRGESVSDVGPGAAFGLELVPLSPVLAAESGLRSGVLVERVSRGSVADGRLEAGDVIVEVNKRPVEGPEDVLRLLSRATGTAFLLVLRDDAQQFVLMPLP